MRWYDDKHMVAEEYAVETAVGGEEVLERMVVKEPAVEQHAVLALTRGKPLSCLLAPELGHRAHILGFAGGRCEEEVHDGVKETSYDVGKGASPYTGLSKADFLIRDSSRERKKMLNLH